MIWIFERLLPYANGVVSTFASYKLRILKEFDACIHPKGKRVSSSP
ncbi:MAG: hypothetical protein LWX01_12935 [Deltaproteobacteria bacterium]|nr:hypothetical protein [Deltaproteobacteria bacterium]